MTNKEFIEAVVTAATGDRDADTICMSVSRFTALDYDNKLYVGSRATYLPATLCGLKVCVSGDLKDDRFFIGKMLPLWPKKDEKTQAIRDELAALREKARELLEELERAVKYDA